MKKVVTILIGFLLVSCPLSAVNYFYGYIVVENALGKNGDILGECQDTIGMTSFEVADGDYIKDHVAFVVANGHGRHGALIAREAVDYYFYLLKRTLDLETQHPQFEKLLNLTSLEEKNNLLYGTQVHKMILGRVSEYLDFFYEAMYVKDQVQVSLTGQILHSGTTLNGYVLDDKKAYLFNIGNSRTVVIRNKKILFETKDHRTNNFLEGVRGLSRSFGHLGLRSKGLLSCEPDTYTLTVEQGDFFVTASDGLWDVLSSEDVLDVINNAKFSLKGYGHTCRCIAEQLAYKARELGSLDDISVIVTYVSVGENS